MHPISIKLALGVISSILKKNEGTKEYVSLAFKSNSGGQDLGRNQ